MTRSGLFFTRWGYLHVPQAVPLDLCRRAMRAINHSIGQGIDLSRVAEYRAKSYCEELREQPVITDLAAASAIPSVCEQLMGEGSVAGVGSGQIALRFPSPPGTEAKAPGGHIDGLGTGVNGIPKGEFRRFFSLLVVMLLDDVTEVNSGNFTVWPGTHHGMEAHLKRVGTQVLAEGTPHLEDAGEPVMTTGRQGDVTLAHYLTLHGVGPHVGPRIRYAVIFRVRHVDAQRNNVAGFTDKWLEFAPLRALDAKLPA